MKTLVTLIILGLFCSCSNVNNESENQSSRELDTIKSNSRQVEQTANINSKIILYENSIDTFSLPFPEREILPTLKDFYKSYTVRRGIGQQDGPDFEYIEILKENTLIVSFNFDSENKYKLEDIYIADSSIVDEYGVRIGMTYNELKKKRKKIFKNQTNFHQHTYVYTDNSNIYYELTGDLTNLKEPMNIENIDLTEGQLDNWKVMAIVWRKRNN